MLKRDFLKAILAGGAALVPLASLPRISGGVQGWENHQVYCPKCGNIFAVLVGNPVNIGPNYRCVTTIEEARAGIDIACACGTIVFVKPWRPGAPV